ncbi:MAG: tetratricopeptide repeat protein, partial [Gemmatimonadetes bacterium]|nr:tetratricopeptide repeat protein [Gemmatimonadota bacterium]
MRFLLACLALCACASEEPEEKVVVVRPGSTIDAELHFDRGTALAARGRHTEAIDAYLQAAELAPAYTKVHYNLGNAYVRQLDYPRAIEAYQRVLTLDSTHVSARHNMAAMYVKQLNYARAIEEHRRVLALDPGHMSTYYDLSYIYFLRGEYGEVETLLAEGVRRDSTDASFHRLLGRMRFKELSFDLAAEALVRSVALDSSDAATFTD